MVSYLLRVAGAAEAAVGLHPARGRQLAPVARAVGVARAAARLAKRQLGRKPRQKVRGADRSRHTQPGGGRAAPAHTQTHTAFDFHFLCLKS
jgi:hypothetical protein